VEKALTRKQVARALQSSIHVRIQQAACSESRDYRNKTEGSEKGFGHLMPERAGAALSLRAAPK